MKSKIYRTCEVTKDGCIYASIQLHYLNNKFGVLVTENSDDLFIDFNLELNNNDSLDNALKYFEAECLNRFTCDQQFTLAEIKENSGEEISFY